jgi:hypothetical protein
MCAVGGSLEVSPYSFIPFLSNTILIKSVTQIQVLFGGLYSHYFRLRNGRRVRKLSLTRGR